MEYLCQDPQLCLRSGSISIELYYLSFHHGFLEDNMKRENYLKHVYKLLRTLQELSPPVAQLLDQKHGSHSLLWNTHSLHHGTFKIPLRSLPFLPRLLMLILTNSSLVFTRITETFLNYFCVFFSCYNPFIILVKWTFRSVILTMSVLYRKFFNGFPLPLL